VTSTTIVAALGDSDLTGVPGASVAERAAFLAGWSDRRLAEGLAAARGAPRSERLRLAVQHIGRHGTVDLVLVTTRQPTPERNDTWMIAELLRRAVPAADEHKWLGRIGSIATIELTQALELAAVLAELEAPLARALTPGARHVLAHGGGTPSISLATLILTVGLASTAARPCEIVSLIEEATGSSRAVTQHVSAAIGSGRALLAPGLRTAIDRARRRRDPAAACALARTLEMAIGDPAGDSIRYEAAAILERRGISDGRLAGRLAGVAQSGSAVRWTADALAAGRRRPASTDPDPSDHDRFRDRF